MAVSDTSLNAGEAGEIRPPTILVAEDEPMVRQLIKSLLTSDGYEVIEGVDGADALDVARRYPGVIDLLLTDVRMPRMNGPELVREIRKDRPQISVVVMSAYSSGELERVANAPNFIRKPFVAKALTQKIGEVLKHPSGDAKF